MPIGIASAVEFGPFTGNNQAAGLEPPVPTNPREMIDTMEALLIESVEPPQNRQRGKDLTPLEYIQEENPRRKNEELKEALNALLAKG